MLEFFHADLFFKFAAALIALLNPLYGIPVFLSLTKGYSPAERRRTATVVGITVLVAATVATLIGEEILSFFGISVPSFQIAGGIIILGIGLSMMKDDGRSGSDAKAAEAGRERQRNIAVVPLAIPLTIGPGTFATTILFAHLLDDRDELVTLVPVIVGISFLVWLGLMFADPISRRLGETMMNVVTRIMAIVLTAIAVEMVVDGAVQAFENRPSVSTQQPVGPSSGPSLGTSTGEPG